MKGKVNSEEPKTEAEDRFHAGQLKVLWEEPQDLLKILGIPSGDTTQQCLESSFCL